MKVGVVAHEARIEQAYNVFERTRADFMHVDNGSLGCTNNHRHVWNALCDKANDDEWIVVVEDDAVVSITFREQAGMALAKVPDGVDVVSFYLGRARPEAWQGFIEQAVAQADSQRAHWILSETALHAVCLAIRNRELVQTMLACTESYRLPIDQRITLWCKQFGHTSAYSHPSLVDHLDGDTVIEGRPGRLARERGRVAWRVGTRDRWTGASIRLRP